MWTLWTVWASVNAAQTISTKATGKEEEKKSMARRKLTLEEQLKGVRAAVAASALLPSSERGCGNVPSG